MVTWHPSLLHESVLRVRHCIVDHAFGVAWYTPDRTDSHICDALTPTHVIPPVARTAPDRLRLQWILCVHIREVVCII